MKLHQRTVLACALTVAAAAHGEDRFLLAGGEAADSDYYSYVGVSMPLGPRKDGRGFVQRYWLDRFGYEYDSANRRIDADAWGGEAAVGYAWSSPGSWNEISAGVRYTDTELSPDDPSADARGSQVGAKLQFQGEWTVTERWRAGFIGSFANQQSAYWSRVRLMRNTSDRSAVGVEALAGGNDEYNSSAAGAVMTFRPAASDWSIGVHAGYRWQEETDSVYAGVELGYAF
jgi:hypothetical protein